MEKRDLSNQWGDVTGCDCFITCDESKGFGVLPQQVAWRALSAHMHHLPEKNYKAANASAWQLCRVSILDNLKIDKIYGVVTTIGGLYNTSRAEMNLLF